jgi:heme/copper-type cytochrome/quinol oxidase subunit 2
MKNKVILVQNILKVLSRSMKLKWYYWVLFTVLVLFLPVALFAMILSPNAYLVQGMESMVDCDSPIKVMICAIPSYIVYGIGIFSFISIYLKTRNTNYLLVVLVCCGILATITPNALAAINQHNINKLKYVDRCGKGW